MKAMVFMFLGAALFSGSACAQSMVTNAAPSAAPPSAGPLDAAKVAGYQARFEEGYTLQKAGQLTQARAVYDGILAEQPEAKRSLLEAGRVSLQLNEPQKADDYLEKLHALVPDFPDVYDMLIQANQALRRDVKVERLIREFRALRDSGRVQGFNDLFFVRERVPLDQGGEIVFSQFFDYTKVPFYALKAEMFGPKHAWQRELLLRYDPDGTAELRAKDPAASNGNVFFLAEPFFAGGKMNRIDVYQELFATPDYEKARTLMLGIFATNPKPVYSRPVNADGE